MEDHNKNEIEDEVHRLESEALAKEQQAAEMERSAHRIEEEAHRIEDEAHQMMDEARHLEAEAEKAEEKEREEIEHRKVEITVIVNGQEVKVKAALDMTLVALRDLVLKMSGNIAQPPENWEFKTEAGVVLDGNSKVGDLELGERIIIFLSLKAGVAGV